HRWFFLTCWTIRLIQKIYVIIIYSVTSCFITHSTLSVIYILYICIKFLNKTNGQTCEKKSTASSIKKRRE
ncbi:Os12g0542601, partial [Oryza sativa Japonica Group]